MQTEQTVEFAAWLDDLTDTVAARKIRIRIVRLEAGNFGDVKFLGKIGELRIDHGPGYRVYFTRRGTRLILLLCGGDKSTQKKDIERARTLAEQLG